MSYHLGKAYRSALAFIETAKRLRGKKITGTSVTTTLRARQSGSVFVATAGTLNLFNLPAKAPLGTCFTFIAGAAVELRIAPAAADAILCVIEAVYTANLAGLYITTSTIGGRVTLTSDGAGRWWATDQNAAWTLED